MLSKLKDRFYGSCLANSDIKAINAYGWSIQFRRGSIINILVRYFGVFHLGARMRSRVLLNVLKGKDTSKKTLLDAGCGIGLTGIFLARGFNKVLGIDLNPEKIKQAKILARNNLVKNIAFQRQDLLSSRLGVKKFDIIICIEVIEHVRSDKKLIQILSKWLRDDGELILSFPSKTLLSRIAQKSLDHYKVGYVPEDIKNLLVGTDLKIIKEYTFGKTVLGKGVVALDFFFRKTFPFLASVFFPLFYLLLTLDYYLPEEGIPRGYLLVIKKNENKSKS